MIFLGLTLFIISSQNLNFELLVAVGMGCIKIVTSAQTIYYSLSIIKGNSSALDIYIDLNNEVWKILQSLSNQKLQKPDSLHDFNLNISSKNSKKIFIADVNISVKAGDKIAITGQSGIGKSTILNSIVSLDDEVDVILQCEDELFSPSLGMTQEFFGYVPQKPEIFPGTLRQNLTLFENASDADLDLLLNKFDLVDEHSVPLKLTCHLGIEGTVYQEGNAKEYV